MIGRSQLLAEERPQINMGFHRRTLHLRKEGPAILEQMSGNIAKGDVSVQRHTGWARAVTPHTLVLRHRWEGTSKRTQKASPELQYHSPSHRQNHIYMNTQGYRKTEPTKANGRPQEAREHHSNYQKATIQTVAMETKVCG